MALVTPTGVTGWSGFWNGVGSSGGYSLKYGRSSVEYRAGSDLGRRGNRKYRAQFRALVGAAPGGTATDTPKRINKNSGAVTSVFTTETVNNTTTTTAAMVTAIQQRVFDQFSSMPTYPVDLSGNGGGGKRGR